MFGQVEQSVPVEAVNGATSKHGSQSAQMSVGTLWSRVAQVLPEIVRTITTQRVPTEAPEIVSAARLVGYDFGEEQESFVQICTGQP